MSLDIAKIKALCFDVDGTLSDTDDQFVLKLTRLLKPFRYLFRDHDPHSFARKVVMTTESPGNFLYGLPDRFGLDDEIAKIGDFVYLLGLGKSHKPFLIIPGVKNTLEVLKPKYGMSIVSARGERSTKMFLEQFDLTPLFQFIATAQTCEFTKPNPQPILWAADKMGVSPNQCLMIGDTTVDILAARAAGAQSVGVLCGFGEEDELVKAGADLILETTSKLQEFLL
jgi:phosphoglycolate phosphatase-like HAD superfamily hydrolase